MILDAINGADFNCFAAGLDWDAGHVIL